jgi:hypothetical protein
LQELPRQERRSFADGHDDRHQVRVAKTPLHSVAIAKQLLPDHPSSESMALGRERLMTENR